jgi:hypothetical protein
MRDFIEYAIEGKVVILGHRLCAIDAVGRLEQTNFLIVAVGKRHVRHVIALHLAA